MKESTLFENSSGEGSAAPEAVPVRQVGKINPEAMFPASGEASPSQPLPRPKVGKLDTRNPFLVDPDQNQAAQDPASPGSGGIVVGKLDANSMFPAAASAPPEDKPLVKVGRIKPRTFLPDPVNDDDDGASSSSITAAAAERRTEVVVGKLDADKMFPAAAGRPGQEGGVEVEVRMYKPVVRPKKMNLEQVFPAASANNGGSQLQDTQTSQG